MNSVNQLYCILLVTIAMFACEKSFAEPASLEEIAEDYFEVYGARNDFDRFMSFYSESVHFEDVIYGIKIEGSESLSQFFDWHRGSFRLTQTGPILTISKQVISNNTVISEGEFKPFYFNGEKLGPWEFVIWQEFNDAGKIEMQRDWINYSPKKIMIGQNNDK